MKKICIMLVTAMVILCSCGNITDEFVDTDTDSVETDSVIAEYDSIDDTAMNEAGDYIECIHDAVGSYHFIPSILSNFVGDKEATKWKNEMREKSLSENDPECGGKYFNIYDFIHHFNVPKAVFVKIYYENLYYSENYDIDLLYDGTHEDVEEYYEDTEARRIENHRRYGEDLLKSYMVMIVNEEASGSAYEMGKESVMGDKYTIGNTISWSIPEFINDTGMTKEQFELAIQHVIERNQVPYMYDYQTDMIFDNKEYIRNNMNVEYPVIVDEMIRIE